MFVKKKEDPAAEKFWRDYEISTGEKVLAKDLGQYLDGWPGFTEPLWGLAIATSGGFRFHHLANESWITAFARISSGLETPKEKTFFIPSEAIISAELFIEKRWWKKLLGSASPVLAIRCRSGGAETEVKIETDKTAAAVAEALVCKII